MPPFSRYHYFNYSILLPIKGALNPRMLLYV